MLSSQAYEPFFSDLLDLFAQMIQSVSETPIDGQNERDNDGQVLAIKLFRHTCTARQLAAGLTVNLTGGAAATFVDHASLKSVARAQLETALVFFYVFGSGDKELTHYRHAIWELGGLKDRLKLTATLPETKVKQAIEQQQADALLVKIMQHPTYATEATERKKHISLGEWRWNLSWQKLGEAAGFHPDYFRNMYSYLCGYSHSSWSSVLQISQAKDLGDQAKMASVIMGMSLSVMARFVRSYAAYFPAAQSISPSEAAQKALEYWSFGAQEMAAHYQKKH